MLMLMKNVTMLAIFKGVWMPGELLTSASLEAFLPSFLRCMALSAMAVKERLLALAVFFTAFPLFVRLRT
jgi:hypothetical protein